MHGKLCLNSTFMNKERLMYLLQKPEAELSQAEHQELNEWVSENSQPLRMEFPEGKENLLKLKARLAQKRQNSWFQIQIPFYYVPATWLLFLVPLAWWILSNKPAPTIVSTVSHDTVTIYLPSDTIYKSKYIYKTKTKYITQVVYQLDSIKNIQPVAEGISIKDNPELLDLVISTGSPE